jgi:hypothetical protein
MGDFLKNRKIFKYILSDSNKLQYSSFINFFILAWLMPRPANFNAHDANVAANVDTIRPYMVEFIATYVIIAALYKEYTADKSIGDPTADLSAFDLTNGDLLDVASLDPDIDLANWIELGHQESTKFKDFYGKLLKKNEWTYKTHRIDDDSADDSADDSDDDSDDDSADDSADVTDDSDDDSDDDSADDSVDDSATNVTDDSATNVTDDSADDSTNVTDDSTNVTDDSADEQ